MLNHQLVIKSLWMVTLLLSTLACNATTQVVSDSSTNSSTTNSADLTDLQSSTQTAYSDAACTKLPADILSANTADETADSSSIMFDGDPEVRYLVVYSLEGDRLGTREDLIVTNDLGSELDSRASHELVWNYFASLIPAEQRTFVNEFAILSDGSHNILAGVSPTYADPSQWTLKVDIVDAGDPYSLTYTLLHEFGHFLTLNPAQVPPDTLVFYHPDDQVIYEQALAACPTYFTGEGCSQPGSYINSFFNRFWTGIYAEWQEVSGLDGEDAHRDSLNEFYNLYKDQFLTNYAATSPDEDMAESWAHFVLSPKPEPTSIANLKILFFYDYPELVALRDQIRGRLCTSFPEK